MIFRSFFIYLSSAKWARNIVTKWPIALRMASRFIAGDNLEDGIQAIRQLNDKGINATLDYLGEHTDSPDKARQSTQNIIQALNSIEEESVHSNVSIKLTQLGLSISSDLCFDNVKLILEKARSYNSFVRIDMEDSPVTQATLDILNKVRLEGFNNVGIVIQAYLYRSEKDIQKLIEEGLPVRLCKGAYKEPASVAFKKKEEVDANYDHLVSLLIDGIVSKNYPRLSKDGKIPPILGLASHDPKRIEFAKTYSDKVGLPKDSIEYQMLNGIRRDLQEQLVREGYSVRVYVPYGTEWYPYYMRRLAERPANLWFFASNFFRN